MAEPYLSQTQQQRLQQVLAPQLRQSLEFLQVPLMELRTLVQQEIEQNPTVEEVPPEKESVEIEPGSGDSETEAEEGELNFDDAEFEALARLDDEWRDYFQQEAGTYSYSRDDEERRQHFFESIHREPTLQEHLLDQLRFADLDEEDHKLGELLIGSINDDGYLAQGPEELAENSGHQPPRVYRVLEVIRDFDPVGVAARDLRECLLLQLERVGQGDSLAAELVDQHLDQLGAHKYEDIARALRRSVAEIEQTARFIATLEPKPGRRFSVEGATYVYPEITVRKIEGEYVIILNDDQIPHVRISRQYRRLLDDPNTPRQTKSYIRDKIRAGTFLVRSIDQRQQTIYNIASEIVRVQRDFLDHGVTHLRPLTMAAVAETLGIHETTVSRAIANKYMQTPQGMYELKYFFTPGYQTAGGESVSNEVVKSTIARLVEGEDPHKPLSDQAIVRNLADRGLKVARRTVAKYRDELNILPSHLRRQRS